MKQPVQHFHFNPLPPYGGRLDSIETRQEVLYFNPLPPYGGRPHFVITSENCMAFQSTPSVWRETTIGAMAFYNLTFQSTPSVWRETIPTLGNLHRTILFQSTPSVWRETCFFTPVCNPRSISIHSLRMEGDRRFSYHAATDIYFNPLPPYGGRPEFQCWSSND